jgi:hypothetical protein
MEIILYVYILVFPTFFVHNYLVYIMGFDRVKFYKL